ncbi:acetate--CoA ligase family protein [Noviherbaspirillum aerium]|uniref:acetate--CoA ligase family protein n=1 Tax=Noviherbaspirillum aerium TaxID=2588497 RepID=UPI00124F33E2|nr:acetate--CoA ligase [Noviherbaspirillum aerium]
MKSSLFEPSSVAVIGASDNPNKVGGRPIHYMTKFGFAGDVFPVNPARTEIQGRRAYPALANIGRVPDTAIIAVAGDDAVRAVQECADAGVANAVVMSSGFAETGDQGRVAQHQMVEYAKARGMRIIGPNAQGIANFSNGAVLNFSTMFMEVEPQDGPIAIVSQSGAASVMPYALLREMGLGVRYLCATGNDADMDVPELTRAVAADPGIKLILVYIESLLRPDFLAEAADIARSHGASIVLLKGGSSLKGAAAAASHTGAMIGHDGALDAFLVRHGIWRAHSLQEIVTAAPLYLRDAKCGERRTVVLSHSGAVGVMSADAAEQVGLPLADLSAHTRERLRETLPGFATPSNPLDLTAALMGNDGMFPSVLDILAKEEQADMLLVGIPVAGPGYDVPALARATAEFAKQYDKPVALSAPQPSVRQAFQAHGIPVFRTEREAIGALHQYASHQAMMKKVNDVRVQARVSDIHFPGAAGTLAEAESLSLLRQAGIPVISHVICGSEDEAKAAFLNFDRPVVVKGCAAAVPHKSEHGLVHLNLKTSHDVHRAARACLDSFKAMGCEDGKVLVAPMVRGVHELMLGVTIDPVFGPVVMMGEGGTLVEVRRDVISLLAPFSSADVLEALHRLRISPLFHGYRDRPALDLAAFADAAVKLGDFACRYRDRLCSIDINPVMVLARGEGVLAVDAVVEITRGNNDE